MTSNPFVVDELVQKMALRGFLPQGTGLSVNNFLSVMTDEMDIYIPSIMRKIREEYLIRVDEIVVTPGSYPSGSIHCPGRAIGAAFRTVQWQEAAGQRVRQLTRVEPERNGDFVATSGGTPVGYTFRGDFIQLQPGEASGILHLAYMQRPGRLVLATSCAEVSSVSGNVVTCYSVPGNLTSGSLVDIVRGDPNFGTHIINMSVSDITGNVMTLTGVENVPSTVIRGDFICGAGTTCIPPFPTECHSLLAQRGAYVLAQAQGSAKAQNIGKVLEETENMVISLLTPRSQGSAQVIVNRYGAGTRRVII